MKKIIKLSESDLSKIVERVLNEQKTIQKTIEKGIERIVKANPVTIAKELMDETKPLPGGKYCFTKQQYIDEIIDRKVQDADVAREYIFLYRIKEGDYPSEFKQQAGFNPLCKFDPKNFRKGDVIMMSKYNELR